MDISTVDYRSSGVGNDLNWGKSQSVTSPSAPAVTAKTQTEEDANNSLESFSQERLNTAIKKINDNFSQKGSGLFAAIERDKATGINVIKVIDRHTEEVISQYPSKKILAIAEAIDQSIEYRGQLLNTKA